jgi:CMP-N,N'-diacetyllegionaminic acid synthase
MEKLNHNSIIALIPARGGSKRLPRKNIKNFLGKPLLVWTIEAAKEPGIFDRIIVSTEDQEIASIGREYGAEVPFIRPQEFAEDSSSAQEVVTHAVTWLQEQEKSVIDWVVFLEPSSPGRQAFHIREVVEVIRERDDTDSIVGISELPGHFSPHKVLQRDEQGLISRYSDGELVRNFTHRNQDLPSVFFINSAIYAFKVSNLFDSSPSLWGDRSYGYVMDPRYALDIDTPQDWVEAQIKMKNILKKNKNGHYS